MQVLAEADEGKKISFGLGIVLDFHLLTLHSSLEDYSFVLLKTSVLSDWHPPTFPSNLKSVTSLAPADFSMVTQSEFPSRDW